MRDNLTPVVRNLLLINVIVFFVPNILPLFTGGASVDFVRLFGLRYFYAESFQPYQLLTHLFVHGGLWHLLGNMFALFVFGPLLEQIMGRNRFLTFYMICGFGASSLHLIVNHIEIEMLKTSVANYMEQPGPDAFLHFVNQHLPSVKKESYDFLNSFTENPTSRRYIDESVDLAQSILVAKTNSPMVGASGAIFGILMAFAMIFPNLELTLLFPPIPVRAKYLVLFYALYELYSTFQNAPDDNIAHFAHIGGMLFAFILVRYWRIPRRY
jgi:membrane associated rhomboid family serine protease